MNRYKYFKKSLLKLPLPERATRILDLHRKTNKLYKFFNSAFNVWFGYAWILAMLEGAFVGYLLRGETFEVQFMGIVTNLQIVFLTFIFSFLFYRWTKRKLDGVLWFLREHYFQVEAMRFLEDKRNTDPLD